MGESLRGDLGFNDFGNQLVRSTLTGLAAGTTAAVMRGGRISVQQVAADAFGNALGSSLADSLSRPGTQEDVLGDFIAKQEAAQAQRDRSYEMYGLGGMGARLTGVGGNTGAAMRDWSDNVDTGITSAASGLRENELAMRRADVERQVHLDLLGDQAREDSLRGAQMFQTGGPARGAGPRGIGSGGFEMVRNGNWDAALNIGADPLGVLPDLAAGMQDVPKGYSLDMLGNGTTVRNYGATVDDLQSRYEGFVRDGRMRETWGDDYQNVRIGRSQMTPLEFEKRVLDVQQQATSKYYDKGVELIARKELPINGDYARTLGNYIDGNVRFELRGLARAEGINDSMTSNIWGVNRSIRSDLVEGRGIPDNRLGYNLFADTTLAYKSGSTEQIMKWNAIRPDSNYLMIRPMQLGGSYVIPRTAIQVPMPLRSFGRGL